MFFLNKNEKSDNRVGFLSRGLQLMGHGHSRAKTVEEKFAKARDFGDERAVEVWSEHLQRTSDVEEKFILYKLLIELYEERPVPFNGRLCRQTV